MLEEGSLSPVPDEPIRLIDPRGVVHELRTDRGGVARLGGLEPGICDVTFPTADGREWTRAGTSFLSTALRHTYWLKPTGRWLRVRLHGAFGEPMRDADVTVLLERGAHIVTMTQPDGMLVVPLPAWAETATIVTATYQWPVALADLRPVEDVPDGGTIGARTRLANLGVRTPSSSTMGDGAGEPEEPFDADLWSFQRRHGLSDSGYLDRSTIQSIVATYGH